MTNDDMINDSQKAMAWLNNTFNNVNYWLSHAENKHGILFAGNVALFSVGITTLENNVCVNFAYTLLLIALIVSMLSFVPKLSRIFDLSSSLNDQNIASKNLYYFDDIADFTADQYIKAFYKNYFDIEIIDAQISKKRMEIDLINEIITNSIICRRKYKSFKTSVVFSIIGYVFFVVNFISLIF